MTPDRTSPFGVLGRVLGVGPLGGLKRFLRWFNLTVLHQALWPLMIVVVSAPQSDLAETPSDWLLVRLVGPMLAVAGSLLYLRRAFMINDRAVFQDTLTAQPFISPIQSLDPGNVEGLLIDTNETAGRAGIRRGFESILNSLLTTPTDIAFPAIARQVRYALLAVPLVVAVLRLIGGPTDDAAKIMAFGIVDVAAYHLIHFGVVPLSFANRRQGLLAGALLFGCSWGLYNALMFGLSDGSWLPGLLAGCGLGWMFGFGSLAIRRWPGGALTAAATHYLIVYLIAGFV
ncbi:MAG: hypothetical protein R2839_12290 [Thermomicrobiales bacterium]